MTIFNQPIDPNTGRPSEDPKTGRPTAGRRMFGHDGIAPPSVVKNVPRLAPLINALDGRIDEFGNVEGPQGAAAGAGAAGGGGQAGGGGGQAGGTGTRPAPGQGAFIPNGEINVPHNSPEGQIISANVGDIDNYVQSVGGWQNIPDGELMNIYHFRTGQHKAEAARQLRNRNLL
jgi:hypothetical protein